jgi:hypothetical protein
VTYARVYLQKNPANFALNFQIRTVDAAGVPGNTILASKTVSNIPETLFADSPRTVEAHFQTPATLTLGQPYALSVTGPGNQLYFVLYSANCPDGKMFLDQLTNGNFVPVGPGGGTEGYDMVYSLTVV